MNVEKFASCQGGDTDTSRTTHFEQTGDLTVTLKRGNHPDMQNVGSQDGIVLIRWRSTTTTALPWWSLNRATHSGMTTSPRLRPRWRTCSSAWCLRRACGPAASAPNR
jgi:hypothetical protein